ncbi:MAG: PIN domain-containing protein [Actinomycetota bacterium]|nr:PIN domain-containing protein [Actinomycetota bacterium]
MADPRYLVDTSALARADIDTVGDRLEALALNGRLWSCRTVDLEIAFSSRVRDVVDVIRERRALPEAPITPAVMDRALTVTGLLAAAGAHRGAKPADLVIAAAAEAADLVVLHYDDDFDRIAQVTHQPTEWIATRGSLAH